MKAIKQKKGEHKETVVLLHGLGRTKLSMSYLGVRLQRAGFQVLNFGYSSRRSGIQTHAEELERFLNEHLESGSRLNFVAHSLGSLVIRSFVAERYLNFQNQSKKELSLGRAVFLGPPSQGAVMAQALSRYRMFRALIGPVLQEIAALKLPDECRQLEIGIIAGGTMSKKGFSPFVSGDNDGIVSVQETKLPGANDWILLRGFHTVLMFQETVVKQTQHFLKHGHFDRENLDSENFDSENLD